MRSEVQALMSVPLTWSRGLGTMVRWAEFGPASVTIESVRPFGG